MSRWHWVLVGVIASTAGAALSCGGDDHADLFAPSPDTSGATGGTGGTETGGSGGTGVAGQGGSGGAGVAGQGGSGATGGTAGAAGEGGSAGTGGTGGTAGDGGSGGGASCVPIGHDEDGDSVDDACDNCPTFANPNQSNQDGDALGNACEAVTSQNILSKLTYFEPWTPAAAIDDWVFTTAFQLGADQLKAFDENCSACGKNALWDGSVSGTYALEANFTYEAGSSGYAGVVFAYAETNGSWRTCVMSREPGSRSLGLWRYAGAGTTQIILDASTSDIEPLATATSVRRKIRVVRVGQTLACEFMNEAGAKAAITPVSVQGNLDGTSGLRVYSANAQFQSFVVYQ